MRQLKISKQITNRDSQSLEKYLADISRLELLTPEEEVELATRARKGDQAAMERLIKANLRFVVSVAKQYQNQGLTLGDLINEGNIGLVKAAQRFDVTRGFKFISYAVWWIRQAILQALAENARMVRLPQNKVSSLSKYGKALTTLEQEHEREPSPEELAEMLEVAVEEVRETMQLNNKHVSVHAPMGSEDERELLDVLASDEADSPERPMLQDSLCKEVKRVLATLTPREADVITMYYGLGGKGNQAHTLEEIGEKFCLTRERVRQIKEKAIRRLRHTSRSKSLKPFLG